MADASVFEEAKELDKISLWMITATAQKGSAKKTFASREYVLVYLPMETTSVKDWKLLSSVQVWVPAQGSVIQPGSLYTTQVVQPRSLLPFPAAPLYSSVRVIEKVRKGESSAPARILAVRAIVACFDHASKFKHFEYVLTHARNRPPVTGLKPYSEEWVQLMLANTDLESALLVKEEAIILNPPAGTFLWVQHKGCLHAALLYLHTQSRTKELLLVRAGSKQTLANTAAAEEGASQPVPGGTHGDLEEDPDAVLCVSLNLEELVLGASLHVVSFIGLAMYS